MKTILFSLILVHILFLFSACGSGSSSVEEVSVYSIAPVNRAVVKDAKGQLAIQKDMSKNIYTFSQAITWPVVATSDGVESYIDVDFDGKKTASDIEFNTVLYSRSTAVTELTTSLLTSAGFNTATFDYNETLYDTALSNMALHYTLDENYIKNATPITSSNKRLAMLSDSIFQTRQNSDYNSSNLDAVDLYFNLVETFYNRYLVSMNASDAAKYHESLVVLYLIDAKVLSYLNSNTTPMISSRLNYDYLDNIVTLPADSYLSSQYNRDGNLAYWDLALDHNNSLAYVAAGNDGFDIIDTAVISDRIGNYEQNISGFGTSMEYFDRDDDRCIAVASQSNEVLFYSSTLIDLYRVTKRGGYRSGVANAKAYDVHYTTTNAKNLELLLIADGVAGLKIIDATTLTCDSDFDLNSSYLIGSGQIGSDTHAVTVSNNRKIVYIADGSSGVKSIDISSSAPVLIDSIELQNGTSAYDIHLAANSNELYVSTDKGVEIFDSDDTGVLKYVGHYLTEGSRANTLGETVRVDRSKNAKALFVADVTGGVKVLDISDSTYPRLCGVAYFTVGDIAQRSAVRDLELYELENGDKKLYIANDSNGIILIDNIEDILFEHCKGLLD
ncbi:MAG: hypothetical protein U9P71_06580 [Campylobacterota bacterium]|nr:hypothetical protein [Campylobacterota bacterium]